jgi:hypothetical protein
MANVLLEQGDFNRRLVEAVVKLRLRDCKRRLPIAADQMEKAQQAITGRLLSGFFSGGKTDPLGELSLAMIEGEVELEIARPSAVIALACLNSLGIFDPEMYIAVKYVDPTTGERCQNMELIRSIGQSFPFTPVFQPLGVGQFIVSDAGQLVLSICAKSKGAPEVQYAIANAQEEPIVSPQTLPAGWGLPQAGV